MFLRLTSASLLLWFGCGGNDVHHLPDAPGTGDGSGMSDAPPDAPPHGVVTMTVFDPGGTGAPAVGIPVVFINADGTFVANVPTDSTGKSSADVMPGASVTVVEVLSARTEMQTVLGAQPGDNLSIGVETPTLSAGSFTVNFTPIVGAAAFNYEVFGPCGSVTTTTGTATLPMVNNCKLDTMEIAVFATSSAGQPAGYLSMAGVPFINGGSVTIPQGAFKPDVTFNASYTDISADVTNITLARSVPDGFGFAEQTNMATTGATLALSLPAPELTTALAASKFVGPANASQQLFQNLAGNTTTYQVDVGANLLPWLGQASLDVTTGVLSMPADSTGTSGDAPDLVLYETAYSRGTLAPINFAWVVFGPSAGNVTLPMMPAALGNVNPQAGDTAGTSLGFSFDSDQFTGYDAVRATPYLLVPLIHPERIAGAKLRVSFSPVLPPS